MPVLLDTDTIPLEAFVESLHSIGLSQIPDIAALLARLPNAKGPEVPGILLQILMYVPSNGSTEDDEKYRDYQQY